MIRTERKQDWAAYEWAFEILRAEGVPYSKQTDLEGFNGLAVVPDLRVRVQHGPLYFKRDDMDLNELPEKEAQVHRWAREFKRKLEGWSNPERELPNQREPLELKVLDVANDMEFEVDGLLDGHEWINAGNGQRLDPAHFKVLGWRRRS